MDPIDNVRIRADFCHRNGIKLPLVILSNGVGRSGKDSFCTYVQEVDSGKVIIDSTINPVVSAVNTLIRQDERSKVHKAVNDKTEEYRQFLHDVKKSWIKFYNGPANYIYQMVCREIQNNIILNQLYDTAACGDRFCDIMFFHCRETEEIVQIKQDLIAAHVPVLTLLVIGEKTHEDYHNDCDANVNEDPDFYNVVVYNEWSLMDLKFLAKKFVKHIHEDTLSQDYHVVISLDTN